jgi:TolB-like protein/DNA-binding winged helix-turn-helix (wHTH) protein/Tfp pilus assembly protein PilF
MNATYRFDRFELNPVTRQLLADGQPLALGARAFDVLLALIERRERLVTKDELLELAWPGLVVEENNLQVQISALRKLLGSQSISTVPGRGYWFTCSLDGDAVSSPDKATDVAPEAVAAASVAATPLAQTDTKPWLVPTVAAAMILAIAAGAWLVTRREAPVAPVATKAETPLADSKSIAVLPFTNMSEDKDTAYFADGVHEDLVTQLALLGELKVVSRTSVEEYRKTTKSARQIATELGVASLVEGSVRRSGNRVRVTAQLIDARSDKHLWGNNYDRELKDIFAIQSELATAIARALKVSLSPNDEARLARGSTGNLAAYELLLRQKELMIRAMTTDWVDALEERIALLTRAVELDPKFALAWARLGGEHARAHWVFLDRSANRLSLAEKAIERALALAPDDIAVRSEVGIVYYYGYRDYSRAAQYFEDLLRIAPNHVDTLVPLAYIRRRQGRWPEVNALLEKALAIDPRNVSALVALGGYLALYRHWDEALSLQRKLVELQPGNLGARCELKMIEWQKSGSFAAYDAWRAALPAGAELASLQIWIMDGARAASRRDFDAVLRLLDAAPRELDLDPLEPLNATRAVVLLAKGERSRAFEVARSSLREASSGMRRQPDNLKWWGLSLINRAVLGERKAVLDEYRRLRARPEIGTDAAVTQSIVALEPELYALLGDREKALQMMVELVRQPGYSWVNIWRATASFASLWDDPRFLAIVNDPANNAPLPIVNQDPALLAK